MKLAILHLSDIHIESVKDKVLGRSGEIATAAFVTARSADATVIAVTGDVTYSATVEQFNAARDFLKSIAQALSAEIKKQVGIVVVPGNHDCTLTPPDEPRQIVIDHILKQPKALTDQLIETCTAVQKNFQAFQNELDPSAKLVFTDRLWREYELALGDYTLRLSALNVSWMSRLKEQPGHLAFPIDRYEAILRADCSARIALLHHPLNWYCQASYHPLRHQLMGHTAALLSGHEHYPSINASEDEDDNRCVFVEAGALQPHAKSETGQFSVVELDMETSTLTEQRHSLTASGVTRVATNSKQLAPARPFRFSTLRIVSAFEATLSDSGGRFVHPDKQNITIDDLFIDPYVVDAADDSADPEMTSAMEVLQKDGQRIAIFGDEKAGKSTLLLRHFKRLHSAGMVPIYIRAIEINSQTQNDILRQIRQQVASQYEDADAALSSQRERITFLVDDLDRIRGSKDTMARFLEVVDRQGDRVIATASTGFRFDQLISDAASQKLQIYARFELQPYGLELRRRLIRKWCLCGPVANVYELDKKVHTYSELLNTVIGKNLVPSHPIYLLILLQSAEGGASSDIQNSGIAHYYQYLIIKSLSDVGVKPDELGEHFNYLANLAWFYSSADQTQVSEMDLRGFNRAFSDKFVDVDLNERLKMLTDARILTKCGSGYTFSYPYAYYFFLGKYIGDYINDEPVALALQKWYKTLHRRESANAILFLSHHKKDAGVHQELLGILKGCFERTPVLEFNSDVAAINQLVDKSSKLLLPPSKVEDNQMEALKGADKMERIAERAERDIERSDQQLDEALGHASLVTLVFRASNLLGQIVKNNYGSLERPVKQEIISEVFSAPLRMLRNLLEHLDADQQSLVNEVQANLARSHPEIKENRLERIAKRIIFHFIGAVCSSVMMRTSQLVGSDKLLSDIAKVVESNPVQSFLLAEAAVQFVRPGSMDMAKLTKLAAQLKGNPFAFTLLQTLGAYRIYMYYTTEEEKQQLCSSLDISMERSRQIDMLGKNVKVNARRDIAVGGSGR